MSRNRIAWMCLLMMLGGIAPRAYAKAQAIPTSVCEITQNPDRFVGRRVSFVAAVESDGIERTVLVDDSNQTCKRGIVPTTDSNSKKSRDAMKAVKQALSHGHPGTLDKRITAHFLGQLSIGKPEEFMMSPGTKIFVLTVESVQDVQIQEMR